MKRFKIFCLSILFICLMLNSAPAHFGMVIPSDNMVMQDEKRSVELLLSFSHPFEMIGMPLAAPSRFVVVKNGEIADLTPALKPAKVMEHAAFKSVYAIKRPGAHTFIMEPEAYWEPAEDCFIIHYTKTVVAAFGDDEGWDAPVGLKTEIVPLSKPFGLYAGNVFQGVVMLDNGPVPYAEVEVEYFNEDKKAQAPSDYMITQTVKADANGVFTYAAPVAGWWGFAALSISDEKKMYDGQEKDIELGAVIWVKFEKWQEK